MKPNERLDVRAHNRTAWNRNVEQGNVWTVPVSSQTIERARRGEFELLLTPSKSVPASWYPPLRDLPVLCLASGGGQQGPVLAAAGAHVTVIDNSPRQLEQDRLVANRDGLRLELVEGDAANLSMFADRSFGMVFHPCSNCFMPSVGPIWWECFRVLKPGGVLLAGFANPIRYIFDGERMDNGSLDVRWPIPYSDVADLSEADRLRRIVDQQQPLEFGHSLDDQIGGQLDAGFLITGFYEDRCADQVADPLSRFIDSFIATRAVKPEPNEEMRRQHGTV
jgi:SAM-dependent methyltransferase